MLHVYLCYAVLSVPCSLVITGWERTDLLALLHVVFSCVFASSPAKVTIAQPLVGQDGVFVTFPYGVPGKVWYLIVSIPNLCLFQNNLNSMVALTCLIILYYDLNFCLMSDKNASGYSVYATIINFSMNYIVMCRFYTDVGGIKYCYIMFVHLYVR